MTIKYVLLIITCFVFVLIGYKYVYIDYKTNNKSSANHYTIGIIQTASHPALDASCKGFTDYLSKVFGSNIKYSIKNVQGDCAQAYSVARSFNANSAIDAVFAIATLAAQTAVQTRTNKPVVLAAVTDPERNGLWYKADVICGAPDTIDVEKQYALLKRLLPTIQNVGLLYSLYEPNSQYLVKTMHDLLKQHAIKAELYGVSQASDLPLVIAGIAKVDALWIPTDNGIALALDNVIQVLDQKNIPLIISDNLLMRPGVLAAAGVNYYQCGQQAAQCLEQVLCQHKKPGDIALATASMDKFLISKSLLKRYNSDLDSDSIPNSVIVD